LIPNNQCIALYNKIVAACAMSIWSASRQEEIARKQSAQLNGRKRLHANNLFNFTAGRYFPRAICPTSWQEDISRKQSVQLHGRKRLHVRNLSNFMAGRDFPQTNCPSSRQEEIARKQSVQTHDDKYFFSLFSNKYCIFAEKLNKY
jgi:hypothetical protein